MTIVNMFDAAKEGDFEAFQRLYNSNVNEVNTHTGLNLIQTALVTDKNAEERIKIIEFLLREGADVYYKDEDEQKNALHILLVSFYRGDVIFLERAVKLLIDAGAEVNATDRYGAIPLKYAITICKMKTEELESVYTCLVEAGSDYTLKDGFDKSCLDYAKEYAWRNGFVEIAEACKRGKGNLQGILYQKLRKMVVSSYLR